MWEWSALDHYESVIRRLVDELWSKQVQEVLQQQHGLGRGSSISSISKFCASRDIDHFDYARSGRDGVDVVVPAVTVCGLVYGIKMMIGMLRASGYSLGERAVRHKLPSIHSDAKRGICSLKESPCLFRWVFRSQTGPKWKARGFWNDASCCLWWFQWETFGILCNADQE